MWPNNGRQRHDHARHNGAGGYLSKTCEPVSEQIWLIEQGDALLLLADGRTDELRAGDVVRTPAGTIHGVANTGGGPFVYLAVTTPPQDFSRAYKGVKTSN